MGVRAARESGDAVLEQAVFIVENFPDAAVLIDPDLHVLVFNAAYALMAGVRRRSLERSGQRSVCPFKLLGLESEEDVRLARQALSERRAFRLDEVTLRNGAREQFTVNVSFLPVLSQDGSTKAVIESVRDVTAESKIQERYKELLALAKARAEDLERQVQERTRELTAALAEVTRLSRHDPLTGLLNRRAFMAEAEHAVLMAARHDRKVAVLMADLDHFKVVNDTFGHQAGDAILRQTAAVLSRTLRSGDFLGRYGGEEFVVLLNETLPDQVAQVGERCRHAVRNLNIADIVPGKSTPQTVSVGAAVFPRDGQTLDQLISGADQAMYQAKAAGRDRIAFFGPNEPAAEAHTDMSARQNAVVLCQGAAAEQLAAALSLKYVVLATANLEEARQQIARVGAHVVISDHALGNDAVGLLLEAATLETGCTRVLILDSADDFVDARATYAAQVDAFLLREEAHLHVLPAIENALGHRELVRRRLPERLRAMAPVPGFAEELDTIIASQQLHMHYQPIVEIATGRVVAYEALCRTETEPAGNIGMLFERAVHLGQIWRLSRHVRRLAVEPLPGLDSPRTMFINLHPVDVDDPELLEGEADLRPWRKQIVFELTERASIGDFARFRDRVATLRNLGYRFAIDDLGTGYASLNSIALLRPDYVKIDMGMVHEVPTSSIQSNLVRHVVAFANDSGIQVVAEGVETAAQARAVTELGCHLAQGYYYSPPTPALVTSLEPTPGAARAPGIP